MGQVSYTAHCVCEGSCTPCNTSSTLAHAWTSNRCNCCCQCGQPCHALVTCAQAQQHVATRFHNPPPPLPVACLFLWLHTAALRFFEHGSVRVTCAS